MRSLVMLFLMAMFCTAQFTKDWAGYTGDLEFIAGWKAGMAEAKFTGKPAMLFFVKKGEDKCKAWDSTAFKDEACKKTLANFVLVIIDGEKEPEARKKYPFKNYPFVKFVNPAGDRLCEIWESANPTAFEMAAGRGLGKHGQIRFTPAYAREVVVGDRLKTAMPLKEYREAIRCVTEIEKLNHAGKILDAAIAAKAELQAEAQKCLAAARKTAAQDPDNGSTLLKAVARDFEGLPEADEAAKAARTLKQ